MAVTTHTADINELAAIYYLNGKQWPDKQSLDVCRQKYRMVGQNACEYHVQRARDMAEQAHRYFELRNFGKIKTAIWCSRAGELARVLGPHFVLPSNHPADAMVIFESNMPFGVSWKNASGKQEPGWLNAGIGTLEETLGIPLVHYADSAVDDLRAWFPDVSDVANERKDQLRNNTELQRCAYDLGKRAMAQVRDAIGDYLKQMPRESLVYHLKRDWLYADPDLMPRYVKVVGLGTTNIHAYYEDPLDNMRTRALDSGQPILIETVGDSLGIMCDECRVMKIRPKYASEKLASAIKVNGEPW